jgi:tetratricopeptide (TPR) repeat protein
VYYQQEQFNLALKDYSLLVAQYPGYQKYYFKRGDTYQKLGERSLAIADYNTGLSINADVNAFLSRAGLYERLKENELALADFAEAIRLKPNQSETYSLRARFYKRTNQFQLAEQDYTKVGGGGSYTAYYGKALLNKAKGDYKAAIKDFEIIPRSFTKHDEAYLGIVGLYVRTGEFEKAKQAIEDLNEEYTYSPLDKKGWRFYKYYFVAVGFDIPNKLYENALVNLDKGIQGYREASSSDEHIEQDFMSDILALKGSLLERLSRFDEAEKAYEEALTFNPIQPDVSAGLEKVRRKTGGRKTLPAVVANNDNTAPVITIVQPVITRGLKVVGAGKELLVKGMATDQGGIRMVSVNGTTVTLDAAGNFSANIPLAAGANNVLVLATDKSGNLAKLEFAMERSPDAVKKNDVPVIAAQNTELVDIGKYYALIIGVQDYDDPGIADLDQPVADASLLYQTLTKGYTFDGGNVILLKNPTRNAIFESLDDLQKKITAQDNLLIFYAGHGYWDEGRKQGYWLPSDAKKLNRSSWITNSDLRDNISPISSKHTLLITDACFAAGIFKSRSIAFDVPRAIKNLYELPSRKAMTSGTLKEVPDKSVFIEYLIKRLTQNAAKYLSAEQLYSSFRDAVINNSANGQVPQYGEIREAGDEGGDFIFVKR